MSIAASQFDDQPAKQTIIVKVAIVGDSQSEKWRLVVGKILQRDIELEVGDKKDGKDKESSFAFIELTDDEYRSLRAKCVASLAHTHGRVAFSLIINRQRNTEYGLELQKAQFLGLVELIKLFLDEIARAEPLDIKPAKLVMIMSQSLYVKKRAALELLSAAEQADASDKLFVVDRVKEHAMWKADKFWKEAYCDSVQQEILKYPAVKKWHADQEQQEAERREEQIIFSQLAAWTHNMKEFGTSDAKILRFLDSRGLKAEQVEVLTATLQLNEEDAHQELNDHDDEKANHAASSPKAKVSSFETADSIKSTSPGLP